MSKDEQCFSSWGLVQILENKMKEKRIVKVYFLKETNGSWSFTTSVTNFETEIATVTCEDAKCRLDLIMNKSV